MRVALVTGAAGSIGRATVRALAAEGLSVVTADRKPLPAAEGRLAAAVVELDLLDDDAVAAAAARIRPLGQLEHVVAVAGGGDIEEVSQHDPATEDVAIFRRVVESNLVTAFTTIRHTVPLLREGSGNRSITLVGSINACGGFGAPGYSAAKAALTGLANALVTVLGPDGIRVNCVALGTVDTENLRAMAAARGAPLDLAAVAARAPLGRVLTASEVADALVAVALRMPGLTGATVTLDNGQTRVR
ncbi:MAG: SDR family oxidoreductase [Actinobacteria bacterium]|nr:SDR family oxidoreductase [Actinomycetota bacterium]